MNKIGKNNKGFTMIEILTVVIILGVLMVVSIPSVSQYIIESRKDTYVSTVKGYVNALKYKINNSEYVFGNRDTTYYVHVNNIPLEKGGDSPFGEWEDAYVAVTFDGLEHTYYWVSKDTAGYMVKLKLAEDITVDDIVHESELLVSNRYGIEEREKIQIVGSTGEVINTTSALEITKKEADECYIYTVSNGKITINEYDESCPKDVEIPATIGGIPVTVIGTYAFKGLDLTTVKIPDGVVTIESGAFKSNKITDVKIGSTVKSIGSIAFQNNLLTSISLPAGVTVGAGAFTNNNIPDEDAMIYKMNSDGTYDYSVLIAYAGDSKDVVIPEKVNGVALKKIESSAFRSLSLTSVVIPDTVEHIGSLAFDGNKLTEIDFPANLKTIDGGAFANNRLASIDIPSSVTSIAGRSFNGNLVPGDAGFIYARKSDGSVDYSTLVSYAGKNKNIQIPSSVNGVTLKTIAGSAFFGCGLTGVVIPNTVTSIGSYAFNANQLPPEQGFIYARKSDGSIDYSTLIGYGGKNRGTVAAPLEVPAKVNGVQLETINSYAFNEDGIKGITLPEGLKTIKANAFNACYVTEITIPSTVTTIENNAIKKVVSWGNFNMLTKIVNKTGKSFNWGKITGSDNASFVTGSVNHKFGTISVVAE